MSYATDLLAAYGYEEQADGSFVLTKHNRPKNKFVPVDGGFLRYRREGEAWRQYPFSIHAEWKGIGGLCFDLQQAVTSGLGPDRVKPQCFEWVFPDTWVETEYEVAVENTALWLAENAARKADAGE